MKQNKDKNAPLPEWFNASILEEEVIINESSGNEVYCDSHATSMYYLILGAKTLEFNELMNDGLDWFKENYPKEYKILLK